MNKFLKYTLLALLWTGVAAYIVFAALTARAYRAQQRVQSLAIEIADSTSQGSLVSSAQVRGWLKKAGMKTVGTQVDAVNLAGIEELILRNGFVAEVKAYVTYRGEMNIELHQRRPAVRLCIDGYDCYVTTDGYVFPAPVSSSVYVPVVTGGYRSPFPADYSGSVRCWIDKQKALIDEHIAQMEKEKYPFYRQERENDENIRALRRMRIKKGWFEKDEAFKKRVQELRAEKELLRRRYRYQGRLIEQGITRVWEKQEAQRGLQKKLEKNYEDFSKLITFVKFVEQDDFWRSEVVQIVAETSVSGALEVSVIPRSGDHIVLVGRLEEVEQKFDRLLRFYRSGLCYIGWDHYRTIDVRYAGQVVCKR